MDVAVHIPCSFVHWAHCRITNITEKWDYIRSIWSLEDGVSNPLESGFAKVSMVFDR